MSEPASERWANGLAEWAIPPEIIDAAPESPWGFPVTAFRYRAKQATGSGSPTLERIAEVLPDGGSLLDVGAGVGAASVPFADRAGVITAVDESGDMLREFLHLTLGGRAQARAVQGGWPEVADEAGRATVVACANVLYNIPEVVPFLEALTAAAIRRVVIELTERHPLVWMNDLWLHFHRLARPGGPTADDAVAAAVGLGFRVDRLDWVEEGGGAHFPTRDEALAFVRRRLCLTADHDLEIAGRLGDRLRRNDEGWLVGPPELDVVTLWWDLG